ncbi:MAG TPA: hypothetical protein VMZ53_10945 [Kofleriaceae bacterium]|nr:hypothetical protein [Kofleriaceae bacterium]
MTPRTLAQLEAATAHVRAAPREEGIVTFMVRRPDKGAREILDEAQLDTRAGMIGDRWVNSTSKRTPDGQPHPEQMLTLMNVRAIDAIAERSYWPLAGDQFYVDFDLSKASLPPGTTLAIGNALVVITPIPHTGCAKFTERFGSDATKWVNSDEGLELRLRGVNARVMRGGVVRVGDSLRRT